MFKDIYKAANDKIKGDPALLARILNKGTETKVVKFTPRKYHYIATSLAAVFALCISLYTFPQFGHRAIEDNSNPTITIGEEVIRKSEISNTPADEVVNEKLITASADTPEKSKSIDEASENTFNGENAIVLPETASSEATEEAAPAIEEPVEVVTNEAIAFALAEETDNTIPAYDESEPQIQQPLIRSAGGGLAAYTPPGYILTALPEGFFEESVSENEITYSDGNGKIISRKHEEEAPDSNTTIGNIPVYRNENTFIFSKNGFTYEITFQGINEEIINEILKNNI